jgi:hypothetical protein
MKTEKKRKLKNSPVLQRFSLTIVAPYFSLKKPFSVILDLLDI